MAANSEVGMNTPLDDRDRTGRDMAPECGLEDAIELLREEVEVRSEWRNRLARDVSSMPIPSKRTDGWHVSPLMALAAALACMVLGGVTTTLWQQRTSSNAAGLPDNAAVASASTRDGVSPGSIAVRFAVMAQGATRVSLVGDFNGWDANATPLELSDDGLTWIAMLPLQAGRHTYAFVIDGEVVADPAAPRAADDDFGTPSSLVLVSASR